MIQSKIEALKSKLKNGVSPAMATPLLADGYSVNTAVIPDLVEFLIEAGSSGLFVGGSTGEGILLTQADRMRLHETAITAVNGRIPVILHAGSNRLAEALALASHAQEIGADAIAAVTPYYYALDDEGIGNYYRAIANSQLDLPLLLYDIPQAAVNSVSPELFKLLSLEQPSIAGIKTSRKDLQGVRQHIQAAGEQQIVLVGNESAALGSLAMGAGGLISGFSTAVPEPFVALTKAFAAGDVSAAQRYHRLINQLLTLLPSGARIGALKQILIARGISMGTAVPPRPTLAQSNWPEMQVLLKEHALIN